MGQVALGIRSLLVKLGLFVLFAALLAWALGGTLLPRVEVGRGAEAAGEGGTWYWRIEVGGPQRDGVDPKRPRWRLAFAPDGEPRDRVAVEPPWQDAAGPVVVGRGDWAGTWYGGRRGSTWTLVRRARPEGEGTIVLEAGRRVEIERALARLEDGEAPWEGATPPATSAVPAASEGAAGDPATDDARTPSGE